MRRRSLRPAWIARTELPGYTRRVAFQSVIEFLRDFVGFLRERKKFWLVPLFIILLLMGLLVFITHGSAIAPLIYTLF
jgi:Family of unknown function (DUF5989)